MNPHDSKKLTGDFVIGTLLVVGWLAGIVYLRNNALNSVLLVMGLSAAATYFAAFVVSRMRQAARAGSGSDAWPTVDGVHETLRGLVASAGRGGDASGPPVLDQSRGMESASISRPSDPDAAPMMSARGRSFVFAVLWYACWCAWVWIVHWWMAGVKNWPNGGTPMMSVSERELEGMVGIPMAFALAANVKNLLQQLFGPRGTGRADRASSGSPNRKAVRRTATFIAMSAAGIYTVLVLAAYTRFDQEAIIYRRPWSIVTKTYGYDRVREVLHQRAGDGDGDPTRPEDFAIVFDDGEVWRASDYGPPPENLSDRIKRVCEDANLPEREPRDVDSIEVP